MVYCQVLKINKIIVISLLKHKTQQIWNLRGISLLLGLCVEFLNT